MDKTELEQKLRDKLGSSLLDVQDPYGVLTLTVASDAILPLVQFLKENLNFGFLTDICGIHYPGRELSLGVVYHMHNMVENTRIRLKTFVSKDKPSLPSMTSLFPQQTGWNVKPSTFMESSLKVIRI